MNKILITLLILISFSSCQSMTLNQYNSLHGQYERLDNPEDRQQFRFYLHSIGHSPREVDSIIAGTIYIGMSEDALIASWGEPKDINTTVNKRGTRKQYCYHSGNYVYVVNGEVSSWQE